MSMPCCPHGVQIQQICQRCEDEKAGFNRGFGASMAIGARSPAKTIRDEFAMMILPALFHAAPGKPNAWGPQVLAPKAYEYADAMMKARDQN